MNRHARVFMSLALVLVGPFVARTEALLAQTAEGTVGISGAHQGEPLGLILLTSQSSQSGTFPSHDLRPIPEFPEGHVVSQTLRAIERRESLSPTTVVVTQARNRAGVPWIIAGSALIVGGAVVGDDVGTILMVGGVAGVAYGLFIYF
jgi:hypothetical protein